MYQRLFSLASSALTESCEMNHQVDGKSQIQRQLHGNPVPTEQQLKKFQVDKPIASNGFILVSANGGLNQQRICNAVGIAVLLNATLVIPDSSTVALEGSEDYFIDTMYGINIVKELPSHLRSLDLEAIGSVITDSDLVKEDKPNDFFRLVLPLLMHNGVVHLLGFDSLPSQLQQMVLYMRVSFCNTAELDFFQKLRCKCNFHALTFVPRIQKLGSLLVRRIRKYDFSRNMLDRQLLGSFLQDRTSSQGKFSNKITLKYLALHLRFEVDMVAHSFCEFGGGEAERRELQGYREAHFPFLLKRLKNSKTNTPSELKLSGRCPLTPEESALVLTSLGFKHEDLLTDDELAPLKNFSSQLTALDFIACATADTFAITETGSQMSSVVSGFRTYFGEGQAPTLRPNHKRLALMLQKNGTITRSEFEDKVKKMIEEGQRVSVRGYGRNLYRLPRDPECMCRSP
ncbi:hypothetical protein V2J09_019528 [Rumex salicifolius]